MCGQVVRKAVLPVLAKLLNDPDVREQVPAVLSQLVADNRELQAAAADSDAISKLAGFLRRDDCSPRLKVDFFCKSSASRSAQSILCRALKARRLVGPDQVCSGTMKSAAC